MPSEKGWDKVFRDRDIESHDSGHDSLELNAGQTKPSHQNFTDIAVKPGK